MPTLSLLPALTGPPPESEPVRVNVETEGREGQNTAGTNSGVKENTWTRLFQSYIQENKQSAVGVSKSVQKSDSEKPKTEESPASSAVASTAQVAPITATPPPLSVASQEVGKITSGISVTPQQTVAVSMGSRANYQAVTPRVSVENATIPSATGVTSPASIAVESPSRQIIDVASPTTAKLTSPNVAPVSPAASPVAPVVTIPLVATTVPATTASPGIQTVAMVAPPSVITADTSAPIAVGAPTVVTVPSAKAAPTKSSESKRTPSAGITQKSVVLAPVVTPQSIPSSKRAATVVQALPKQRNTTVSQQAVSPIITSNQSTQPPSTVSSSSNQSTDNEVAALPEGLPSAVLSAISTIQLPAVSGGTQPVTTALPIPPKGLLTNIASPSSVKAGMDRDQVLGQSTNVEHKPDVEKDDQSNSNTSSTSDPNAGKFGDSDGQTSLDGSFADALVQATPISSAATAAANTALVQTASPDERIAVVNQISQHIQSMQPSTSDPNTMTVTVQPPHWGEVKIAVTLSPQSAGVSSSSITATVTASTTEVQGALQQHVQDLRDSLKSAGIHLDKLDVGVGAVSAMSQSGNSSGHHSGQQSSNSGGRDFQASWSGGSASSNGSGSQFQSMSGQGSDPGGYDGASAPITDAADQIPESISGTVASTTTRIDMRA